MPLRSNIADTLTTFGCCNCNGRGSGFPAKRGDPIAPLVTTLNVRKQATLEHCVAHCVAHHDHAIAKAHQRSAFLYVVMHSGHQREAAVHAAEA
jgi:hypothetical protein